MRWAQIGRSDGQPPRPVDAAVAAAAVTLAGIVLSGPGGMLLVATHPQPAWTGAEAFARAFHPVQTAPYFAGLLLVGGSVFLIAALGALAGDEHRARMAAALAFAGAFAALIFFNYILQTTVVPALARSYAPENAPLISLLSLSNPRALGWALEMWGYAVLGVATWLVAPVFWGRRLERVTAALFVANGPISIAGGVWTAIRPGWEMSALGLALFSLWNVLMAAMVTLTIVVLRSRGRPEVRASSLVS